MVIQEQVSRLIDSDADDSDGDNGETVGQVWAAALRRGPGPLGAGLLVRPSFADL